MTEAGTKARSLAELAAALGGRVSGDGTTRVSRANDLVSAGPGDLAALYDRRRLADAKSSSASALVVAPDAEEQLTGRPLLVTPQPKATFARAIELLHPREEEPPGIHATAVIDPAAEVSPEAHVGPFVVVSARCSVGAGASLGAGTVLLKGVMVGAGARLHPRVVVYEGTSIGDGAEIYAGAVVGAPGFGQARDEEGRAMRLPHLGRTSLGEGAEVGANATIDRATFGETRIGRRARLDNLVQVGHNAEVGDDAMIAAQSGLSGSSRLGAQSVMGGQSGLADHVEVAPRSAVAAKSAVFADVSEGEIVAGIPAMPIAAWRRMVASLKKLPQMRSTLRKLSGGDASGPGRRD